jgi:hypothetical protein
MAATEVYVAVPPLLPITTPPGLGGAITTSVPVHALAGETLG